MVFGFCGHPIRNWMKLACLSSRGEAEEDKEKWYYIFGPVLITKGEEIETRKSKWPPLFWVELGPRSCPKKMAFVAFAVCNSAWSVPADLWWWLDTQMNENPVAQECCPLYADPLTSTGTGLFFRCTDYFYSLIYILCLFYLVLFLLFSVSWKAPINKMMTVLIILLYECVTSPFFAVQHPDGDSVLSN